MNRPKEGARIVAVMTPVDGPDDESLVARFLEARRASGGGGPRPPDDRDAELAIIARLRPLFERCAVRAYGDFVREVRRAPPLSVNDLVQATFAKLFEEPDRTLGRWEARLGPLDGYAYRIAYNTILNVLRGERRKQAPIATDAEPDAIIDAADLGASDEMGRRFLARVLERFFAEATVLEATVFHEVIVEELAADEVARRHKWAKTNTTNLWRHRLLRRLRDIADELRGDKER